LLLRLKVILRECIALSGPILSQPAFNDHSLFLIKPMNFIHSTYFRSAIIFSHNFVSLDISLK